MEQPSGANKWKCHIEDGRTNRNWVLKPSHCHPHHAPSPFLERGVNFHGLSHIWGFGDSLSQRVVKEEGCQGNQIPQRLKERGQRRTWS